MGTGWVDGSIAGCGDRRMSLCSGPFTMAAGDTQEVVVAAIAAQGANRLASVGLLKYYDDCVQSAFDALFNLPQPPAVPTVSVAEMDREIVLDWSMPENISATESQNSRGYKFEGYNVYQLPSAAFTNPKRLATFDVADGVYSIADEIFSEQYGTILTVPVQQGNDLGLQRYFDITKDYIADKPLVNGRPYYFAVTAYNYTPDPKAVPVTLETPPKILTVTPQAPTSASHMNAAVGDTVAVTHASGKADATIALRVVNPKSISGHTYDISVVVLDSIVSASGKSPNSKWQVVDRTTGAVVLAPNNTYVINTANPVVDGVQLGFKALPYWVPHQEVAYLAYAKAGVDINTVKGTTASMPASNWAGVNNGLTYFGGGFDCAVNFLGSALAASKVDRKIEVRFNSAQGQNAYCFTRTAASGTNGAPYTGFFPQPFSVWDITEAAAPRQVDFWFMEVDGSAVKNQVWGPSAVSSDREYCFISNETYSAAVKTEFTGKTIAAMSAAKPVLYSGWFTLKDASKPAYANGDVWRIVPTNFLTTSDVWSFSTAALAPATGEITGGPVDNFDMCQNYPNPFNPSTSIRFQLPATSHVRLAIFDVLGREVAVLVDGERGAGAYTAAWMAGSNLSSGVYFCRLTAGSFTMTKKLLLVR